MEAVREEIRNRNGINRNGIAAQPFRSDQPVEIRSGSQSDGRPGSVCHAAPVGKSRHAHQKIAGHVGCFCGKSGDPRSERASSEEICFRILVCPLGKEDADADDCRHVQNHGDQMLQIICLHDVITPFTDCLLQPAAVNEFTAASNFGSALDALSSAVQQQI